MTYTYDEAYNESLNWFGGDELAAGVFVGKYALRDSGGNLLEKTPEDMFRRLAKEFARIEQNYNQSTTAHKILTENDVYSLLCEFDDHLNRAVFGRVVAQGSPMTGIGNDHKLLSLSNCFVIEAPYDSYAGILHADQEQAQIMKRRGGVGFDLSNIRPEGIPVANAAGTSDGIEIFMDRYSNTTREVAQNGRRGALMLTLSVHHPEVLKFIKIKQQLNRVTGANISVRVTDAFMNAVQRGEKYVQYWPCTPGLPQEDYDIYREVDAKEIWSEMMQAAWQSAEPGILFWDTVKTRSPADIYADEGFGTQSTNPCLVGSTRVMTDKGVCTLEELALRGEYFNVLTFNENSSKIEWDVADAKLSKPLTKVLKLRATNGKEILLTPDHQVLTESGWVAADKLKSDQKICGINNCDNLSVEWVEIESIEESDEQEVYDITCMNNHNFFANDLLVHNCGEIVLSPYDSCRLMVVNLSRFVKQPFTPQAEFDWDAYGSAVYNTQRLMDDMIDLEIEKVDAIIKKIEEDEEPEHVKRIELELWSKIRQAATNGRRTGTGITALGDVIAALGLIYGSSESIEFTDKVYKELKINTYKSTIDMAADRGAFPVFNLERDKAHPFIQEVLADLPDAYVKLYHRFGRRNIALTTTAPTGSVSVLTQTTSGIEPAFMTHYTRRRKINPSDSRDTGLTVDFVDEMGDSWTEYTVFHHWFKRYLDVVHPDDIDPKHFDVSPYKNATANDVDWVASVDIQATAQRHIDHAISKTCNLPNNATVDVVDKVYTRAWQMGCKGFTVYRDGSRSGVLISTEDRSSEQKISSHNAPKRPETLDCHIHHANIKGEKWTILIGLLNGIPYEVLGGLSERIELPKKHISGMIVRKTYKAKNTRYDLVIGEGDEQFTVRDLVNVFDNPNHSAFTRTISLALRHGVPINYLVEQLQKDKDADMFSFSRVIARTLKKYIEDGTKATGVTLEGCETPDRCDIKYIEGCATCATCGLGACG